VDYHVDAAVGLLGVINSAATSVSSATSAWIEDALPPAAVIAVTTLLAGAGFPA
jgi:hypothetical protein